MVKLNIKSCVYLAIVFINMQGYAEELKVKMKGGFEFQAGHNSNDSAMEKHKYISTNRKDFAFNSSANFNLNIHNEVENLFEYGAKLGLETTTKNDRRVASSLYLISNYGKVELGSEKSANAKMKITASSVSCGTGGGWDSWVTLPMNADYVSYISNNGNFLDAKTREMTKAEYSRKISYYTPEYKGFQLGLSYVADTTNAGYSTFNQPAYHSPVRLSTFYHSFRDGLAYGATFEHKFDQELRFKTSFVGEKAKVDSFSKSDKQRVKVKLKDLNTYTLGAEAHYGDYSLAGSYGSYLKSITSNANDTKERDSKIFSLAGRYKYNKLSTSLSLFTSDHQKNGLQAVTLGTEYKAAPGLLPYGEITSYKTDGKYINKDDVKVKDKVRGLLFLLGVKLEI